MFQLLAHAITPVPSYADTAATMRYRRDTWMDHTYVLVRSIGELHTIGMGGGYTRRI